MMNEPSSSSPAQQVAVGGVGIGRSVRPPDFASLSLLAAVKRNGNWLTKLALWTAIAGMVMFFIALVSIYILVN